jgi:hypothetical protein
LQSCRRAWTSAKRSFRSGTVSACAMPGAAASAAIANATTTRSTFRGGFVRSVRAVRSKAVEPTRFLKCRLPFTGQWTRRRSALAERDAHAICAAEKAASMPRIAHSVRSYHERMRCRPEKGRRLPSSACRLDARLLAHFREAEETGDGLRTPGGDPFGRGRVYQSPGCPRLGFDVEHVAL